MRDELAIARYTQRYIEPGLPELPHQKQPWQQVLVIPCYRESPAVFQQLAQLQPAQGKVLVILVLNRPDTDSDTTVNDELRSAFAATQCLPVAPAIDVYLYDLEAARGALPADKGVGLARKAGCDLALQLIHSGSVESHWIASTDADAQLPPDYFSRLGEVPEDAVAAVFPFAHVANENRPLTEATQWYEVRLHHYVLGLEFAGSPYAFHTLGSCLAVRAGPYAHTRGFPARAAAEDFYFLNKVSKLGPIARLSGPCVHLASRQSDRVPFGTGPAVTTLLEQGKPQAQPLFYHPKAFDALRCILRTIAIGTPKSLTEFEQQLVASNVDRQDARFSMAALQSLGFENALAHCQRQSRDADQFQRHFHQWFDGFRTLKFIHYLRDHHYPMLPVVTLGEVTPQLWPNLDPSQCSARQLLTAFRRHWGWEC